MSALDAIRSWRARGLWWGLLLYALDIAVVVLATAIAYYARFEGVIPPEFARLVPFAVVSALIVYIALFTAFGLYRLVLRYVGLDTMLRLSAATFIGFALLLGADFAASREGLRLVPIGVLLVQATLILMGAAAVRAAVRVALLLRPRNGIGRRVLIVGAGSAGSLLLREIQNRPDLGLTAVGFLDDAPQLRGRTLGGIRILGATRTLGEIVAKRGVDEVIVAMPSAPKETVRRVLNEAADAGVETRIIPSLVIERGSVSVHDLRRVDVEDLLGREPTPIDVGQIANTIEGKVVAVTGAAGSIGSELCRQILTLHPKQLLLIEIDESRLYELWLELKAQAEDVPVMCVCDIRDARKLDEVFGLYRPELVLHAAAYKHVPVMELAPEEAIKTNVLGTLQVIGACEHFGVRRLVHISTDKAVAPVNMMGLTKALAERAIIAAARRGIVQPVAVRFGNVLASRGSVVPIFEEQLRHGGPLTVTHPDVTRYFMTIPEAARLVLQAQAIGESGEVFVLDMGEPVSIVSLARKMIALSGVPADIEFIGLRPGEKLHESLVTETERLLPTRCEKILRVDRVQVVDDAFDADIAELVDCAVNARYECIAGVISTLEPNFGRWERVS